MRALICMIQSIRYTPFATGPDDTPGTILDRIGKTIDVKSGAWERISPSAKVLPLIALMRC